MSLMLSLALIAADIQAAPAPAPEASPSTAATPAPEAQPAKEKKICKVDEEFTGSRLAKRRCLTESQWKERERSEGRD